jgi:hypothetical protein
VQAGSGARKAGGDREVRICRPQISTSGSKRHGTAPLRGSGFVFLCGIWARNDHVGSLCSYHVDSVLFPRWHNSSTNQGKSHESVL